MVKPGALAVARQAQIIGGDVSHVPNFVAGDKNIFPTVVVVVKEPGGKARDRELDVGRGGDLGEFPSGRGAGRERAVIAEEHVGPAENGEVEIGAAIIIEIAAGHAFDVGEHGDTAAAAMLVKVPSWLLR